MKISGSVCLALALLVSSGANAFVVGGSNLGFMGYPKPMCTKPMSKPVPPFNRDRASVDIYNMEVEQYNLEWQRYIDCVNEYVTNAKSDIDRITEAANDLLHEAKDP